MTTGPLPLKDHIRRMTPVAAPLDQRPQALALVRALETVASARKRKSAKCHLVGPDGNPIAIPDAILLVLARVAEVMARGDAISIVPVAKEMTTQQAAALLNVSRQYLVRLLDENRIPFRMTGKHRRLQLEDVLAFKEQRDKDRRAGLRDLSQTTQALMAKSRRTRSAAY
jgi:excisionase family DNA binding protein